MMKYWAFISYTSADEKVAKSLHRFLERYSVPRQLAGQPGKHGESVPRRLYPVFRDRDELGASASLPTELKERLSDSRWLVLICTRHTPLSRWVNEEVQQFIQIRGRQFVICVFPHGIDSANQHAQLPEAIAKTGDAPGGVDLSGKEKIAIARLRLIAALTGLEFSVLEDREVRRRRERLIMGMVLVIAVGGAIVAFVIDQRSLRENAVYASALSSAGLPAEPEDVASLRENVRAMDSPIVSWRGRRFIFSNGILKHAIALDDADYVLDPAANILLVLSKDGGNTVAMLDFPSLSTVIGQTIPADGYGLDYQAPAIRIAPDRYVVFARTQSASAGRMKPVLVMFDAAKRQVTVLGLEDEGDEIAVAADCSSFALAYFDERKELVIEGANKPSKNTSWISWKDLADARRHTCTNLLPMVRRDT